MNQERFVESPVMDDETFPYGVKRLLPVTTYRKKKGGYKTVYAFPFDSGESDETDELQLELDDAVGFVNLLLSEASELSGYDFGAIGAIQIGITQKGYGFTRVEVIPGTDDRPAASPVHLRIETTDKPGEPNSLNAVIEYGSDGYVMNVLMTEYGDNGHICRVMASHDYYYRDVQVMKVVEELGDGSPSIDLYRRYHDSRYEEENRQE